MLYHERENYTKLSKNLIKLTATSTSILNLKDVIEHLSPSYLRQEFDAISDWIGGLPFGLKSLLYSRAGKIDLLLESLEEQKELEWLKVYDKALIEQGKRNEVKNLYLNYAIDHLENHVGRKAHEYVSRINHRLISLSENKMLTEIQEKLYDRFADRTSRAES